MKSVLIGLAFMLAAAPAAAQDTADATALIDTLVVNARTPGPPWWSVSKGDAKVWIMGVNPGGLPTKAAWDTSVYERRLGQSRLLIRPDKAFKFRFGQEAKSPIPWIDRLTPTERARFSELAATASAPRDMLEQLRPNLAALFLDMSFRRQSNLANGEPYATLTAKVKAVRARERLVKGDLKTGVVASMTREDASDLTCLRWTLAMSENLPEIRARAEAWTRGDVRRLMRGAMAFNPCEVSMHAATTAVVRQNAALAGEISATLEKRKSAVALVDLVPLLMQGGVLDQLRARGYVVRTPAVDDD